VGGLVSGDPIFVNGVERGRVDAIDLLSGGVVVRMGVTEKCPIPTDSRIQLQSVGIMGERNVAITRGLAPTMVAPGDTLQGELLMGLSEVLGSTGDILSDVEVTTRNLRKMVEELNADGKLRAGVNDFAATGKNLREITETNRKRLDDAIASFEHSSKQIDQLLSQHYAQLDSSLTSLGRAGGKVDVSVDNLVAVSQDLKEITAGLRAGKGSAGRLLNDETLVRRLESTTASLDTLLKDLREHPGRYVKFSLF
jgi:phospholipid/cholesterol/gamma-HCH transport system substrate-binding protein